MSEIARKWAPGQPVLLETPRLILRSLGLADAGPRYLSWLQNEEVQSGLNMPTRQWTQIDAQRHIARFNNRDSFHLGIFTRAEDELIGFTSIFCNPQAGTASRNTVVGETSFWGKGLASEAGCACLDFVFDQLGMHKVSLHIEAHNIGSRKAAERIGYVREGVLREEALSPGGGRTDIWLYGLLRREWHAVSAQTRIKYGFPDA